MQKRMMALATTVSLLVMVLMVMAVVQVVAAPAPPPPTVDGLFYGDPEGNGSDQSVYQVYAVNPGRGTVYFRQEGTTLYLAVVLSTTVNDNVVGSTKLGGPDGPYLATANWTGGHSGKDLDRSDNVQIQFSCGTTTYDWYHGYLYDLDGDKNPQEPDWASGPNDGSSSPNPSVSVPPSNVLLQSASSMAWNMNNSKWDVTLGAADCATSPTTRCGYDHWKSVDTTGGISGTVGDNNITDEDGWGNTWWNTDYNWEWALVYELSLELGPSGAQCSDPNTWDVDIPSAHNSPSKDGNPDVPFIYDFGDLPYDPANPLFNFDYPTLLAQNGARHLIDPNGPVLGQWVDDEDDGFPDNQALGDDADPDPINFTGDDEDGVKAQNVRLIPGQFLALEITATVNSVVDVFLDFNGDGDFDDTGEYTRLNIVNAIDTYNFLIPQGVKEYLYARFRVSWDGIATPTGLAPNGEVEDHFWQFTPLSVGLVSFTATADSNSVLVQWKSANELDNIGYHLQRATSPEGPWTQLNDGLIASVAPGSPLGGSYDYLDIDVEAGRTYYYTLVSVDSSGASSYHNPVSATVPAIDEPIDPPSPAGVHRIFLPFVSR